MTRPAHDPPTPPVALTGRIAGFESRTLRALSEPSAVQTTLAATITILLTRRQTRRLRALAPKPREEGAP